MQSVETATIEQIVDNLLCMGASIEEIKGKLEIKTARCPVTFDAPKKKEKVKRRPSGFNLFQKECLLTAVGDVQTEKFKSCALKWGGLPDGEKDRFKEEAKRR